MPRSGMRMPAEPAQAGALYHLLAWLSPAFPTGAFSYSHGLEAAVEAGAVHDRATLEAWIAALTAQGSGRIDADLLCDAWHAAASGSWVALADANRRGAAFRATAELALESTQQGAAFVATCRAAWPEAFAQDEPDCPHPNPPPPAGEGAIGHPKQPEQACLSVAFGAAAARAGIALEAALLGYLQAFAANLVSAGIRLGVIGQTDGQRILAGLEPVVAAAVRDACVRDPNDFGSAAFAADLHSMAHETQYSRLFRS